jgi:hypothetical protein
VKEQPDLKAVTIPWAGGTYFGPVSNGVPDNMGKWTHPEGHEYVGEFRDGERHGRGTYTSPDGTKVVSKFKEGLPDRWRHVGLAMIIGLLIGGPHGAALLGFVALVVLMKPKS